MKTWQRLIQSLKSTRTHDILFAHNLIYKNELYSACRFPNHEETSDSGESEAASVASSTAVAAKRWVLDCRRTMFRRQEMSNPKSIPCLTQYALPRQTFTQLSMSHVDLPSTITSCNLKVRQPTVSALH